MRLPVAFSILAHVALLLIALRLPARELSRAPKTVTFEIQEQRRPVETPVVKPPPPPLPPPVQPREKIRREVTTKQAPPEPLKQAQTPPQETPKTEPPPTQQPQQQSSLSMRPTAPVDLNLHNLSGVIVNPGNHVSGGEGGPAGTFGGTQQPRKQWKMRGDAGDPLLGKLPEEKEERFPLALEGDGYHYKGPSFSAKIAMDGQVSFEDHSIRDFKGLSGGFDVTDLAMKAKHQDPYRYEKERFMDSTAKLRGELVARARRDRLEASLASLPAHLEQVWNDLARPANERRRVLFAMWREASGSDAELGPAGRKARTTIESFIRERLPEGSSDAFTDDELRKFNARVGAIKFEPYKAP